VILSFIYLFENSKTELTSIFFLHCFKLEYDVGFSM